MNRQSTMRAAAALGLASLLALSACSSGSAPAASSAPSSESSPASSASASDQASADASSPEATATGAAGDAIAAAGPVVAEQKVTSDGHELVVKLHQLKATDKTMTMVADIQNTTTGSEDTWFANDGGLSAAQSGSAEYFVEAAVVSPDGKKYLPGRSADGKQCACTREMAAFGVKPGATGTFYAVFAAPSTDAVTVQLGNLATFKDVKVER